MMRRVVLVALAACVGTTAVRADDPTATEQLAEQAAALRPLVDSPIAHAFLDAVSTLPLPAERTVYRNAETRDAVTVDAYRALPDTVQSQYDPHVLDASFYYFTRYGSPLAFVRGVDLLGARGVEALQGTKWVDFGFGSIGQLKCLAAQGATAVGVEVDPLLEALYSDSTDTGHVLPASPGGTPGEVRLVFGQFPADSKAITSVGGDVDVFVSKNTLKRGYIHPEQEVDPRMLVHLGVDDATFLSAVYDALAPGGWFLIYNLCPPQSEERYLPWADGRCPFDRVACEAAGFVVVAYDEDDTAFARRMGKALGWAEQMNLETDLFGLYTILRKR